MKRAGKNVLEIMTRGNTAFSDEVPEVPVDDIVDFILYQRRIRKHMREAVGKGIHNPEEIVDSNAEIGRLVEKYYFIVFPTLRISEESQEQIRKKYPPRDVAIAYAKELIERKAL